MPRPSSRRLSGWASILVAWAALLGLEACRAEAPPVRTRNVRAASLERQTSERFDQIEPIVGGLKLTRQGEVLEWKLGDRLALPQDRHTSGHLTLRSVGDQHAVVDYQVRFDARSLGKELTEDEGSFMLALPGAAPVDAGSPVSEAEAKARALSFLKESNRDWGEPTIVRRTAVQWYRVEFARSASGAEQVVLVNPENGRAELPLSR